MSKSFIILVLTLISILVGLALTLDIYVFAYYTILLGIASVCVLLIVIISLLRGTSHWKLSLKYLSFGYLAALTAHITLNRLELRNKLKGDTVISALYDYRQKEGKFPRRMGELQKSIASTKGNYVPDSTLTNFKFYYRDLYGIPKVFSSKDSTWER